MSEEENIEQRPEEVHSTISPEQTITSAELSNQTSDIPKSEIKKSNEPESH